MKETKPGFTSRQKATTLRLLQRLSLSPLINGSIFNLTSHIIMGTIFKYMIQEDLSCKTSAMELPFIHRDHLTKSGSLTTSEDRSDLWFFSTDGSVYHIFLNPTGMLPRLQCSSISISILFRSTRILI